MPADMLIYGASAKTRLVVDFLAAEGRLDEFRGIVDRDPAKRGTDFHGLAVVGGPDDVGDQAGLGLCISLSERNFASRLDVQAGFVDAGFSPRSIVSRTAEISPTAEVADGCIVFPGVRVQAGARIGTCVTLYTGALIEHDCVLADNVEISPRCVLAGGVEVAEQVFVGIGAMVLPYVKLGRGATVGGGAVVTRDVPPDTLVVGNPARPRD